MWSMPSFFTDRVEFLLNSRLVQSDGTKGRTTTSNSNAAALQAPRLSSYSEVVNHMLRRYANDETIEDADVAIHCFSQPAGMIPLQYGEALLGKANRVGDVYDEGILNGTFIEGLD